jgi:hypothetical protein
MTKKRNPKHTAHRSDHPINNNKSVRINASKNKNNNHRPWRKCRFETGVNIVRGKNKDKKGVFINYTSRFYCRVHLDDQPQSSSFMRTSVEAAPTMVETAIVVREVPDVRALLNEVERVKEAISVLETSLRALLIED